MSSLGDTVIDSDSKRSYEGKVKERLVLMTADVHACGIFLGVDRVFNIFESDEAEASGFFSLLVVNEFATLEKRRNEI